MNLRSRSLLHSIFILLFWIPTSNDKPSATDPIQKKVSDLVKELHQINGNYIHGNAPKVIIKKNKNVGAAYNPLSHTISLDLALYELCQTFGEQSDDALVFVLGHELAHCYMEHDFFTDFFRFDKKEGSDISKEKRADIYGLFNAYLAGYQSFKLVPEVISKIYDIYTLQDKIDGYPPKEERMALASAVTSEIEELIQIFEAANYLSALGEYELAAASYEYISGFYQGREIYNNIGVNYTLQAMNFTGRDYDLYLYPLEIDWDIRIKKPKKGKGIDDMTMEELAKRQTYLQAAEKNLKLANRMDANYHTADINLICVLTLQGKYEDAISYGEDFLHVNASQLSSNQLAQLHLIMAITKSYIPSERSEAIAILGKYKSSEYPKISYQAQYNQRIIEEGNCGVPSKFECNQPIETSAVDGVKVHRFISDTLPVVLAYDIHVKIQSKENSIIFQYIKDERISFTIQQNVLKMPFTPKSSLTLDNTKIINSSRGYFLLCEEERQIFHLSNKNQLIEWSSYY